MRLEPIALKISLNGGCESFAVELTALKSLFCLFPCQKLVFGLWSSSHKREEAEKGKEKQLFLSPIATQKSMRLEPTALKIYLNVRCESFAVELLALKSLFCLFPCPKLVFGLLLRQVWAITIKPTDGESRMCVNASSPSKVHIRTRARLGAVKIVKT